MLTTLPLPLFLFEGPGCHVSHCLPFFLAEKDRLGLYSLLKQVCSEVNSMVLLQSKHAWVSVLRTALHMCFSPTAFHSGLYYKAEDPKDFSLEEELREIEMDGII